MQNSLSTEGKVLEFTTKSTDTAKGVSIPGELTNRPCITMPETTTSNTTTNAPSMQSVCVIKKFTSCYK